MPFIRRLLPTDLPRVKDHFARLDADDRYLRFGHGMSSDAVARYLDGIDWLDTILLGHMDGGEIRGLVEVVPLTTGLARLGELALTVERTWRGRGLGTELCRRALVLACNRSIREVAMICLAENVPMQRIAARLDGRVLHRNGGIESRVQLPRPSPWSLIQEVVMSGGEAVGGLTDQWATGNAEIAESPPPHSRRPAA
jgi:GNAT superfamily N-acetyltransferase